MEITADNINVSSDDSVVSQRMPAGGPADAIWWLSMSRLPADHHWVTVRHPDGERRISVRPPVGFFPPITPQIPTSRWAEAGRRPGDVPRYAGWWVNWWTSADHPPNFNCELKCSGRCLMSQGWALQECLFGRWPPDFSPMGTKWGAKLAARWLHDQFFSIGTSA